MKLSLALSDHKYKGEMVRMLSVNAIKLSTRLR